MAAKKFYRIVHSNNFPNIDLLKKSAAINFAQKQTSLYGIVVKVYEYTFDGECNGVIYTSYYQKKADHGRK